VQRSSIIFQILQDLLVNSKEQPEVKARMGKNQETGVAGLKT
jgi:hypothetical protein